MYCQPPSSVMGLFAMGDRMERVGPLLLDPPSAQLLGRRCKAKTVPAGLLAINYCFVYLRYGRPRSTFTGGISTIGAQVP